VKTICPPGWSDEEGEGMDVCGDVDKDVGKGVGKLKMGVVIASGTAGDENEEGVEACNVANRSGVGEDAGLKTPHPRMKTTAVIVQKSLVLFMIQLD